MNSACPGSFAHTIKRVIVWVMIISFSAAAVGGIVVLLGDIWSETASQVLATTALTGTISVAVFCGATLIARPGQWFGIVTITLAVIAMALFLAVIWADYLVDDIGWNWVTTASLLTACAAVSSLVLLLVRHASSTVRIALALTLGLLAVAVTLTLIMIWAEDAYSVEWLSRLIGITWILAALGVVLVPVSSLLLKGAPAPHPSAESMSVPPVPRADEGPALSSAAQQRIESVARAEGVTPDELINRLLGPPRPED